MAKSFCSAVQHGLCITAYGAVNPCCASLDFKHITEIDNIVDYVKHDVQLKEAQAIEHTDSWLEECLGCKDKSAKGLMSRKDKMIKWFPHANKEWSLKNPDAIVHMDISFGNTCSQQCVMCSSNFSSKWLAADLDLYNTHTEKDDRKFARNFDILKLKNWSLTYDQLDQIASLVSEETRTVEIKGGEPLYDKRFEYFVNAVLEKNPNVRLSTNTNGIHFNKKNNAMLNKIKKLNIDVSYDGTGKVYEWIRSVPWEQAEQNFNQYLKEVKHRPCLNYTTMMYNVDHFETYYNWAADVAEKHGRLIPIHFTQVVNTPRHIGPGFASKDRIKSGIEQLERIIDDPRQAGASGSGVYRNRIEILIKYLTKCYDQTQTTRDLERSVAVQDWFANVRGWDIREHTNL
jgi:organic radical activating enzyme